MFLTLYCMAAVFMQFWKFRSVYAKLLKQLDRGMSVVFYDAQFIEYRHSGLSASSDLCTNYGDARIAELLYFKETLRGVSLFPKQTLPLGQWIKFPTFTSYTPFNINKPNESLLGENNSINVLIEAHIVPTNVKNKDQFPHIDFANIQIENYGQLIAWKVDSRLGVVLRTDINLLTKLVIRTFIQQSLTINNLLPLIRIETVAVEGIPQPFDAIRQYLKHDSIRPMIKYLPFEQWDCYLNALVASGVLPAGFECDGNSLTNEIIDIITSNISINKSMNEVEIIQSLPSSNNEMEFLVNNISNSNLHVEPFVNAEVHCSLKNLSNPNETNVDLSEDLGNMKCNNLVTEDSNQVPNDIYIKNFEVCNDEEQESSNIVICSSNGTTYESPTNKIKENESQYQSAINGATRPKINQTKSRIQVTKPPNIFIYSESTVTRENVVSTLKKLLQSNMYTIYPLSDSQISTRTWIDNTLLLIVCGSVSSAAVCKWFTDYFVKGGNMICLCSNVLHLMLPMYHTAEVREQELVQFSYGKWKKVKLMHHIFCYQASPVKNHFSTENESFDQSDQQYMSNKFLKYPKSIEIIDLEGMKHNLDVQILGTEETWNTPSLMLASNRNNCGKAIFAQVHLETDPNNYENDESKYSTLIDSDPARLEIFSDILNTHFGIAVISLCKEQALRLEMEPMYANAFFLGRHESKFEFLENIKDRLNNGVIVSSANLALKFCASHDKVPRASSSLLPILIHACPEKFSTIDYFENLKSEKIGRLVIYAPLLSSSMDVLANLTLEHGLVVIPGQQTAGNGRNKNQWLSPEGCAMFTLQLHIPLSTCLGQKISLLQHLIGVAIVNAVLNIEGYAELDLRLKWPNDIYANGCTKIGGMIINTQIDGSQAICNIGCGINLNNSNPTLCINDLITHYNRTKNKNLPVLQLEYFLALVFTEIEKLLNIVQSDDLATLYSMYYKLWLHGDTEVTIIDKTGTQRLANIIGIDEYGYLLVQTNNQSSPESVHPDGNSFDMIQGLIIPK